MQNGAAALPKAGSLSHASPLVVKKNRNKGYDVLELGQIALAAQRIGLQLQQTAPTVNGMPQSPDARTVPGPGTPSCLLSDASPC